MIDLSDHNVRNHITRTVNVYPAAPFVIDVAYTQTQKQYVDRVVLEFHKIDDRPWKLWNIKLIGDRMLKDGSRGAETKVSGISPSYNRREEDSERWLWLTEIINFFTPEEGS